MIHEAAAWEMLSLCYSRVFVLGDKWTRRGQLRSLVPEIMEAAAGMFKRITEKGRKDAMLWMDAEAARTVREDILKELLVRTLVRKICDENRERHGNLAKEGGLLATPQGYTAGELNTLSAETVSNLMVRGWAVQDGFLGNTKSVDRVWKELELLDFESSFQPVLQQESLGIRTDRVCFKSLGSLDREKHAALAELFHKLISLPFELNKKCNLMLQAMGNFQLGAFASSGAFYKKHVDGGYGEADNGRKITVGRGGWTRGSIFSIWSSLDASSSSNPTSRGHILSQPLDELLERRLRQTPIVQAT